ncbi:hypothetical protein IE4771_CH03022 [Rhizobium etli bv. mimosae str. IE4771]|uniref:Uncharacterized protein n=1 Tax=Rhizobium etli bv. mimosae str. IE4771 TaxID=1432050 RepID=A0A060I955_RHIET|nr:hypothetical protein IE4771_CH03022 [Rhizobium sp. IE4771]
MYRAPNLRSQGRIQRRDVLRQLGLVMMLLGVAGTVIGFLGSFSPWALDFNLWLSPNFLEEGYYPELLFIYLVVLSLLVWFFGALARNYRPSRRSRREF